jgi:hypothetical protein
MIAAAKQCAKFSKKARVEMNAARPVAGPGTGYPEVDDSSGDHAGSDA